jgi:hypothetical protein
LEILDKDWIANWVLASVHWGKSAPRVSAIERFQYGIFAMESTVMATLNALLEDATSDSVLTTQQR